MRKRLFPNAEGGIWTLAPLLTTYSLSRGAPSTTWVLLLGWIKLLLFILTGSRKTCQRRGWDSNPRALADKRFSRPPRYDHFDTSPCAVSCFALTNQLVHNTKYWKICQGLFWIFLFFSAVIVKSRRFSRKYKDFVGVPIPLHPLKLSGLFSYS